MRDPYEKLVEKYVVSLQLNHELMQEVADLKQVLIQVREDLQGTEYKLDLDKYLKGK